MTLNRRQFIQYLMVLGTGLYADQGYPATAGRQHTRIIPSSGELLPVVGLGSWITFGINLDNQGELQQRQRILAEFLNRGGGVLDSSPMYGNAQQVIGRCLKRIGQHHGLFSATKVWTLGEREGVLEMENSRLFWGLPRLDLMQVHNLLDWQTHLPTLQEMKARGEIRYVGVTTSHGRRHQELIKIMKNQKLDFVQFTYNLLDRDAENYLLPMARDKGFAVIINRPFQRGGLFDHVRRHPLPSWAADIDCDNWAQFFLKFIVSHPAVTCAIPATSKLDHLQQNMAAAYGRLPDPSMRGRMIKTIQSL
ncbi:MAG: aldo/keto reductase [Gammaproteobacteria bacterium]|nr:aldo/keto reductase [Gammaproteobacteria bacterium]